MQDVFSGSGWIFFFSKINIYTSTVAYSLLGQPPKPKARHRVLGPFIYSGNLSKLLGKPPWVQGESLSLQNKFHCSCMASQATWTDPNDLWRVYTALKGYIQMTTEKSSLLGPQCSRQPRGFHVHRELSQIQDKPWSQGEPLWLQCEPMI